MIRDCDVLFFFPIAVWNGNIYFSLNLIILLFKPYCTSTSTTESKGKRKELDILAS